MREGTRILVVDDDENCRKLICDVLRASGYDMLEASTGEEGILLARSAAPALIFLDYRLPRLDGVAVMQLLQSDARTRNIPVVAITASAMPDERETLMAAGFRDCRTKPIRVQELRSLVAEVLGPR